MLRTHASFHSLLGIFALSSLAWAGPGSPSQPPPPTGQVSFGWNSGGSNNMERFREPFGYHLAEGQDAHVRVNMNRFLFDASRPIDDPIQEVVVLVRDEDGHERVEPLRLTYPLAEATIRMPQGRTVQLGFAARTAGGHTARDTRFGTFYQFALIPWAAPSLLRFDTWNTPAQLTQPQTAVPTSPLYAGQVLLVEYTEARAQDPWATDAGGNVLRVADCSLWSKVGNTLSVSAKVEFYDEQRRPIGRAQEPVLVGTDQLSTLRPQRALFQIPDGARSLRLYFEVGNYNGVCAWDSHWGSDYHYPVEAGPPPSASSAQPASGGGVVAALSGVGSN